MKLTVGAIHDIFLALTMMDRDEGTKFSADVRFKIGINWNLARPIAEAYERARNRALAGINAADRTLPEGTRRSDAELQADFAEADSGLRAASEDVSLRMFTRPDLKLDENLKIGGIMLARLAPIIETSDA